MRQRPDPDPDVVQQANQRPPFSGELMKCLACGCEERSNPGEESDWRMIEADGVRFYFCKAEFPPDGPNVKDLFSAAYSRAMGLILADRLGRKGRHHRRKILAMKLPWS